MNKKLYIPKLGDSVGAKRKDKSISPKMIVGPVTEVYTDACRIVTNPGTEIEGNFYLPYSDWDFQFLFKWKQ